MGMDYIEQWAQENLATDNSGNYVNSPKSDGGSGSGGNGSGGFKPGGNPWEKAAKAWLAGSSDLGGYTLDPWMEKDLDAGGSLTDAWEEAKARFSPDEELTWDNYEDRYNQWWEDYEKLSDLYKGTFVDQWADEDATSAYNDEAKEQALRLQAQYEEFGNFLASNQQGNGGDYYFTPEAMDNYNKYFGDIMGSLAGLGHAESSTEGEWSYWKHKSDGVSMEDWYADAQDTFNKKSETWDYWKGLAETKELSEYEQSKYDWAKDEYEKAERDLGYASLFANAEQMEADGQQDLMGYLGAMKSGVRLADWMDTATADLDTAKQTAEDLQKQIDEAERALLLMDDYEDDGLYGKRSMMSREDIALVQGRSREEIEAEKTRLEARKKEADKALEDAGTQYDLASEYYAGQEVIRRQQEKQAAAEEKQAEAVDTFDHGDRWWNEGLGPFALPDHAELAAKGVAPDVGFAGVATDYMDELTSLDEEARKLQQERADLEVQRQGSDTSQYDPTTVNLFGLPDVLTDEEYQARLADIEERERELADKQRQASLGFNAAKAMAKDEPGYQETVERGQLAYDQFAEGFRDRWIENSETKDAILQDMADRAETDASFLGTAGAFQLGDAYARSRREKNLADVSVGEDWSDDEANWYHWLMGTGKQDEAFAYAESLNRYYNDKAHAEKTAGATSFGAGTAKWKTDADGNFILDKNGERVKNEDYSWLSNTGRGLLGFGASLATMPDQFVSWMDKVATTALSETAFGGNGYYAGRRDAWLSDQANALLAGRAQQMNENGGTLGDEWGFLAGKGWGDAYQLANSMVQSFALGTGLTSAYMAGGLEQAAAAEIAEVATLAGFFGQAANSAFDEAIRRGANANQATYISMMSGVAEVAGEKFSLENLLNQKAWMGNWFAGLFMQGVIEGSEEGFTDLLNLFGDEIGARLTGGKTEMEQELAELMSSGMSYKEASKKIWRDMAFETAFDVLGGFLSGGMSGAPMQAVQAAWGQTSYKGEGRNSQESLLQEARSKGGETAKMADEYDGQRFTKQRAQNLKQSIADADISTIENAAKRQLQVRDSSLTDEQAGRLAKAVLAEAMGEADAGQQELLNRDNKFGTGEASRLVFELQTGVYTNQNRTWLNDLNTTRVTLNQTERSRQAAQQAENLPASFDRGVTVNGEALTITGISSDGAVQAKNSKGETVTVDKADLSAEQRTTVDTLTRRYGTQAGAVLRVMQTATGDFATLGKAADMIYTVATNSSKDFDAGMLRRNLPTYARYFNDEQMKALWDAARFKRAQEQQSQQKRFTRHAVKDRVVGEKYEVRDGGRLYVFEGADLNSSELTDDQKATIQLAGVLTSAAKGRLQINFYHGGNSGFFGQYQNGRIDLNIDRINEAGKSMVTLTLAHELTHFIQDFNAAGYNTLKTFMIDKLMDSTGKTMEQLIKEKQARQIGLDRQGAIDEIIADGCEMMLQDGSLIDELGKIDRKLAVKVKDFVKGFLDRLSQELTAKHYEATELGKYVKEQQELWNNALTEAMQSGKTQNKTKAARQSQTAEKQYSLNDVDIDRNYINYGDETAENQAVKNAVQKLRAQGKYVNISARDAAAFNGIDYSDFKKARGSFKKILERFLGKTIELIHKGGMAQVYLTRKGINHAAVTDYTPGKAAVYSKLRKMIQNSVYAYSSQNDPHAVDQAEGKTEWDAFVALARFGKYEFPTVFKFRTTDSDVRSQLYNIVSKREIGASHGAGLQTQNGQPNYGLMPISDDTITQNDVESKGQMSKENAPVKQQFSMADAVEQTDRLVAIHNKSLSGLQRMLERGGVPFPSIAIKKAGTSHEGFGDVSIVFPRETIDPEASKWNRLYSNDAWTPTEPRTEYDVGETYKLTQKFEKLLGDEIYQGLQAGSYLYKSQLERDLLSSNGNVFDALKGRSFLKYAYLQSIGQTPNAGTTETRLDGFGRYKNPQLLAVFQAMDANAIEALDYNNAEGLQRVADALNEQFRSTIPAERTDILDKLTEHPLYTADKINPYAIKDAFRKYQEAGYSIPTEVDTQALDRQLRDNREIENDPGYREYVEDTFQDLIKDSGIPNGKGAYTDSGNRRSFRQRHVPATLENIVQQMRKEKETGIGVMGINLRGAATRTYSNVEEMRADSGKLLGERISDDVYDSYMKGFHARLHELAEIAATRNTAESWDVAQQTLLEAIRDAKSKKQMDNILQKNARWIRYSEALTENLWTLRNDVQNMPAPYFEAKPRRVVNLEEALAYILPDTADAALIDSMRQRGLNVVTYEAENSADRLDKLNSVEGAQFSREDVAEQAIREGMSEEERYDALKNRHITVRQEAKNAEYSEEINALDGLDNAMSKAEKVLIPLAKKLGILNRNMTSPEVDIDFTFSKNRGLHESAQKQLRYGGNYQDFAKALIHIDQILQDAVLLEKHTDKYKGTVREDPTLENVSVLMGAFRDGDFIIPVQFEIKKSSNYGGRLYMTVAMTKIRADVFGRAIQNNRTHPSLISATEYRIAEIFREINPADKHFLKYISDGFLNSEQIAAKREALKEDADRIASYEKKQASQMSREDVAEEDLERKLAESEAARGKLEKAIQTAQRQLEFWRNESDQPGKRGIIKANPRDVQRFAKGLLEEYPYTTVKASQITERIQQIAEGFMNQEDTGELYRIALEVAEEIIENSYVRIDNEMNLVGLNGTTDADLIKQHLKGYIYVSEQDRADIASQLSVNSFEQVRRKFFKYGIYLTSDLNKATRGKYLRTIDSLYEEIAPSYGWKAGMTTISEMMEIIDAAITEDVVNPYYDVSSELSHMDIDYVAELAETIFEGAISEDVRQYFTRAEKAARQLDEAKANAAEQKLQARERLEAERENNRQALKRERQRTADVRKRLAATRATDAARLRALREQKNRRMNEIIQEERRKRRDLISRNRENRARRETREKIWKLQREFKAMQTRPAEGKYIPRELMGAVADMLSVLSSAELRQQESRMDRIDRQLEEMSMSEEQHGKKAAYIQRAIDRLGDVQDRYADIAKDEMYAYTYNEAVKGMLDQLKTYLYGTHLTDGDMSADTLKQIYNMMNALMYTVKNANKLTAMEYQAGIRELAKELNYEMDHADAKRGLLDIFEKARIWQMRPDTFFRYICGYVKDSIGEKIQQMFVEGTQRKLTMQRDFYNMFQGITESRNADERKIYKEMSQDPLKQLVSWGLRDVNGEEVFTTRGMMLQAYMLLEQEDSARSLAIGGFLLPNLKEYYHGNYQESLGKETIRTENRMAEYGDLLREARELKESMEGKTEKEQLEIEQQIQATLGRANEILAEATWHVEQLKQNIEDQLTAFDKKIIQTAHEWYDYSGRKLDETNMDLYGFKKQRPKGYVPIHRDLTSVMSVDIRDIQNTVNLENAGFTKSRVKSTNPIILTDILMELDGNQARMSNFYGFVKVQHDFNAIWKCKVPDSEMTIQGKVEKKFGKGQEKLPTGGAYVENYVRSVAGGANQVNLMSGLYGNTAAATLSLNPKVALSQLASIPTAAAELGWMPVMKGLARGLRTGMSTKAKQELAQKSVWFWQRFRGEGGMREFAEIKNNRGTAVGRTWNRIASTKVGSALLGWCQDMDVLATASMWAMAEEYVKARGVDISTEEGQQAVGDAYRDVIRKTQPNYTATERSDLLRDQRAGIKFLTMYKTQSNQNLNILMEANGEFIRARKDLKAGTITQADMNAATAKLARSYTAVVIGGSLTYAALRTVASFLMGALSGYRDDDDELTAESIRKGTMKEFYSSLAGMDAFTGILYDLLYSSFSGEKYYGISDNAMGALSDTLTGAYKTIQSIMDDTEGNEWEAIHNELKNLCTLAGIPLGNAEKFLSAAEMYYNDLKNGTFGQFEGNVERKAAQEAHRLLNAFRDGDEEKAAELFQALQEGQKGGTDWKRRQQAESFIKNQVKTWYVDDADLTEDQAREILTTYGGMTEDEANEQLREWLGVIENGYDYGDAKDAFISGDLSEDELRIYAASYMGLKDQDLEDAVVNLSCERDTGYAYKDLMQAYVDGAISEQEAVEYRMKYGGYNKAEAEKLVQEWTCEKETGIAYSKITEAYIDGVISKKQVVDLQMKYGGKDRELAEENALHWTCEKETGVKWDDIQKTYIDGKITRQQVINMFMKYGGLTREKAEEKPFKFDFNKDYPEYKGYTVEQATKFRAVEGMMSIKLFDEQLKFCAEATADKDKNGKSISGSKKAKIIAWWSEHDVPFDAALILYEQQGWSMKKDSIADLYKAYGRRQ